MQEKTLLKQKIRTSNIHSSEFGSVSYDIFGSPYQKTGSFLANDSLDFGYLGKPYNATTELYDYGFRDYSPEIARFTTVDPIRDGRNWYSYVVNDPVNYVGLWGLQCQSESDKDPTFSELEKNYDTIQEKFNKLCEFSESFSNLTSVKSSMANTIESVFIEIIYNQNNKVDTEDVNTNFLKSLETIENDVGLLTSLALKKYGNTYSKVGINVIKLGLWVSKLELQHDMKEAKDELEKLYPKESEQKFNPQFSFGGGGVSASW